MPEWFDLGAVDELSRKPLQTIAAGRNRFAVSFVNGEFGVISAVCNHAGGPLGDGRLEGDYVVCPWHNWKFHARTGAGEPGVMRVVGISTTVMDRENPRYSTSDALLDTAIQHARNDLGVEAKLIQLNALKFRSCEGYYSKAAQACTWPCSITQMDPSDQLDVVYEAIVHWAGVILVSTPIRWGAASSLYFKMVERMNCIQNQVTIRNRVLMKNKTAAFIITGGQDNVQAVAGQMLGFFAEIGCTFPQFPYLAHSRGWRS